MYAMTGTLTALPGRRAECIQILLRAAQVVSQLPGCHLYLVAEDAADERIVHVMEAWVDKAAHDDSLQLEEVRGLVRQAMPLMATAPSGREMRIVGGHGL